MPSMGGLQAHTRVELCIPACTEADPPHGRLLPQAVRILLECILVDIFFDCGFRSGKIQERSRTFVNNEL